MRDRHDEPPDWSWTEDADMPSDAQITALARQHGRPDPLPLSPRQVNVLRLLSHGLTIGDIAKREASTMAAVHDMARQARTKLAAKTNEHAVAIAYRRGLID